MPQEISQEEAKKIFEDFNKLEDEERGEVLSTLYRLGSEPENLQKDAAAMVKSSFIYFLIKLYEYP